MTDPTLSHPEELLPWFVNGTLEGEDLRRVEEHLASCMACRQEVETLRELQQGLEQAARAAPEPPPRGLERFLEAVEAERAERAERTEAPRSHRHWFRPWQAAAALMAVVGFGLWWSENPSGSRIASVQPRAGSETEVLRSLLSPDEALPRDACVLRWQVPPDWREALFAVTVTTEALTPVADARGLEETKYQVPAEVLGALPPGARLFWRVEAVRPDGTRRSKVFQMHVE